MTQPAPIYEHPQEVESALRGLGLSGEIVTNAILFAEAERRTCTDNDPIILKGVLGWARGLRSLREQLRPLGWHREEPSGLPLIVSPDRTIAITIATGDDQTGNRNALFASTKQEKGRMLRDWVQPYAPQLSIYDDDPRNPNDDRPELWVLLIGRTDGEIRAELSRPTSVTVDGRIRFGATRILLTPIPIDQILLRDQGDDETDDHPVDVKVERI